MTRNQNLERLSNLTFRSYNQTEFLFNLVGKNYKRLVLLEWVLFNNSKFHSFVPTTPEEVETVLGLTPKSIRKPLSEFYEIYKINT